MIARLSTTITTIREFLFRHTPLRLLCCLAVLAALLLFWLYGDRAEVTFVYNAF